MIYCQNCGNALPEDAAFCGNCGTPVQKTNVQKKVEKPKPVGKVMFEILRKEEYNMVRVQLENAAFRYEAGALHYMQGNLKLDSKAPRVGKMMKSIITQERLVRPVISGTGEVFLQPSYGEYHMLELNNEEWILDRGAYFASEMGVEIDSFTNSAISAMFSGEKWFQTKVKGTGKVIITTGGPIQKVVLNNDKLVVDGSFAVARTPGVNLKVTRASKGIFSSIISGEGLLNTFSGTGTVLIAPVSNYINSLVYLINNISNQINSIRK